MIVQARSTALDRLQLPAKTTHAAGKSTVSTESVQADLVKFSGNGSPAIMRSRVPFLRFAAEAQNPHLIKASKQFVYQPDQNVLNQIKNLAEKNPDAELMDISRMFPIKAKAANKGMSESAKTVAKQFGIATDSAEAMLLSEDVSLTNKELWDSVKRLATGLKKEYNIQKGDRIALIENNTYEFMKMFLATQALGASVVPVNILAIADPADREKKLGHMLKASNSKLLFIGNDASFVTLRKLRNGLDRKKFVVNLTQSFFAPPCVKKKFKKSAILLQSVPKQMKIITNQDLSRLDKSAPMADKDLNLKPGANEEAILLFTSGTTSMPKGVPTTYRGLQHAIDALDGFTPEITAECNVLSALPQFHIFSLAILLSSVKKAINKDHTKHPGPSITMLPSLKDGLKSLHKFQDTMELHKIRVLSMIPGGLQRLLKEQPNTKGSVTEFSSPLSKKLRNMRLAVLGGDALPKDLYETAKKVNKDLAIWEGFGQTEGWVYTVNKTGLHGNVGVPISDYISVEIKDPDADGNGEIWIQTPSSAGKYVGVPEEESKEVFHPDDWIKTGDIGKLVTVKDPATSKDQRALKITGRVSDIIKRNGERLSPEDFNTQIKSTVPVADAMTLSMFPKSTSTEEKILSIVLLPPGSQETEATLKDKLMKAAKEDKIAFRYVPHYILPLHSDKFPEGFISVAGKKQTKVARQFIKNLVDQGGIDFNKDGIEIKNSNLLVVH